MLSGRPSPFPVIPGTTAPLGSVSVMLVDPGWTEVSNLTEIAEETGTDVDWSAGVKVVTVGAAPGATVKTGSTK